MKLGAPAKGWSALALWALACGFLTLAASHWPTDNRLESWAGQIETDEAYLVHRERFGGDESAVLRLEHCDLSSAPVREFVLGIKARLEHSPAVSAVADAPSQLKSGELSFEALRNKNWLPSLGLVDEATRRLDFLVAIRLEATPDEREEFSQVLDSLRDEGGTLGLIVRTAGHPLLAAELDRESKRVEAVFAPALAILALLGSALFLRSFLLALIAILPAVLASSGARAALSWLGIPSDLILVAVGPLNFVLMLAATLHFITAYKRFRRAGNDGPGATHLATREKLGVGVTAALTTAVGFGVFATSNLRSVSLLGMTVACTVLLGVPVIFGGLAPLLRNLLLEIESARRAESHRWWRRSASVLRARYALLLLGLGVLLAGAWSANHLDTETNALHYFPRSSQLRADFTELEQAGRSLSSIDVLMKPGNGSKWKLEALREELLGQQLAECSGVRDVFGPRQITREFRGALASVSQFPALRESLRLDREGEWARWTVGIPTAGIEATRTHCDEIETVAHAWAEANDCRVIVTGTVSRMLAMQGQLVNTLATSLSWTLVATTLLFLFVVRSLRELLAAFFTNLLPVASTLAFARAFSLPLDGATVMVAAVVLGLAVDNTFHIVHSVGGGRRGTRSLLRAYDKVGEPATIASAGLTLGFLTLAFSGFAPTARFGALCAVGAATALVADLYLLPVLWSVGRRSRMLD